MTIEITKALGINLKTYDDVRSAEFSHWCSRIALEHNLSHRSLLLNQTLYKWYLTQWVNDVELPFTNELKTYLDASIFDPAAYQDLFWEYPKRIHEYYPQQLLKKLNLEQKFKTKKING